MKTFILSLAVLAGFATTTIMPASAYNCTTTCQVVAGIQYCNTNCW